MLYSWTLSDIKDTEITPPRTARPGPPFSGRASPTHSSCREGRWENIRSLISENVPFTRLLRQKRNTTRPRLFEKCWAGRAISLILHLYSKRLHQGMSRKTVGQGLLGVGTRGSQVRVPVNWINMKLVWITETFTTCPAPSTEVTSASLNQLPLLRFS